MLFRINSVPSRGLLLLLRHQGLTQCLLEQSFSSGLYEVHWDAASNEGERGGFLPAMIHSINEHVNSYSKSNSRWLPIDTKILQDARGIMSFKDELGVGITGWNSLVCSVGSRAIIISLKPKWFFEWLTLLYGKNLERFALLYQKIQSAATVTRM